jgi:hypothetical protein
MRGAGATGCVCREYPGDPFAAGEAGVRERTREYEGRE